MAEPNQNRLAELIKKTPVQQIIEPRNKTMFRDGSQKSQSVKHKETQLFFIALMVYMI